MEWAAWMPWEQWEARWMALCTMATAGDRRSGVGPIGDGSKNASRRPAKDAFFANELKKYCLRWK